MQENKILNLIIPIVAVVIIFESVVLVSNLSAETNETKVASISAEKIISPTPQINAFDLVFVTANKEMKVGKNYKVDLNLIANKDFFADGIETYINYDPKSVVISGLVSGNKLPEANLTKVDNQNGIIKNIILVDDIKGYKIIKGELNQILSFNVAPKKEGLVEFEISSGNADKEFVTMIVETATSNVLTFSSSKLQINATK